MLDWFLGELAFIGIKVIAISGNHDSRRRLGFGAQFMARQGIHLVTEITCPVQKLTFFDEHGPVDFYALPYVRGADVSNWCGEGHSTEEAFSYLLSQTKRESNRRSVLLAHQFFAGAKIDPTRSDSERIVVGATDRVGIDDLQGYSYVALGHLHGPQQLGSETIRYAGTPIAYSMSERNHIKSIVMVELGEKETSIELLPIPQLRHLRVIEGSFAEIMQMPESDDFIAVVFTDTETIPLAAQRLRTRFSHLLSIQYAKRPVASVELTSIDIRQSPNPAEMFAKLYQRMTHEEMNAEQRSRMADVFRQLEEEDKA